MVRKNNRDVFTSEVAVNARIRGQYHKIAANVGKCVFCDLRDKYILCEKNGLVLTVNLFPYIDGQLLVIPRRHIEDFNELTEKEAVANFYLSQLAIKILHKKIGVKGVWMILRDGQIGSASGKTVKHLHWNIMPYSEKLNTWHYQKIKIAPIDLATKLRPFFRNEGT